MSTSASSSSSLAGSTRCNTNAASPVNIATTSLVSGLRNPWGIAFLPDGRILVTERGGYMRIVNTDNTLSADITPLPTHIYASGQGGLLDVALDPNFANNSRIWLSFAETDAATGGSGSLAGTAVASATLNATANPTLSNVTVVWRQSPKVSGSNHFGSRLVFTDDDANPANGTQLFITVGERMMDPNLGANHPAQLPGQTLGKVIRLQVSATGVVSMPVDNPFISTSGYLPEIWSLGHRNVQGAALNPATGQLWTAEHGAQGGDEINTPEAGKNYGWPVITYGVNYGGASIGVGTALAGMEQPRCYWDPSIAPSGVTFYPSSGAPFSTQWGGNIFVGALAGTALWRLTLSGTTITGYQTYSMGKRVRDVTVGPDGYLYLLIDANPGEILRVGATP
ncbi:MAG: PQQ-dependent sugar dehydrogenase [Steroidobacteraceae bacterium]